MYLELEKIFYGLGHSFASIAFKGARFVCPYHQHREFELVSIDSSRGRLVVGKYHGSFHPGDLYLLGENLPHYFKNTPLGEESPESSRSLVIQFRSDFAGEQLFTIPEFRLLHRLLHSARLGLKVTGNCRDRTRERMNAVHQARGPARITKLLELLIDLSTSRSLVTLAGPNYDSSAIFADGRMSTIMAHIQETFTGSIHLPEVARKVGLTPNAFCRYFKLQTRRTFTDVINEMRVNEACRLLSETSAPVTEICYACGFGNLAHFHTEFRERTGQSPLRYRKKLARPLLPTESSNRGSR